MAEGGSVTAAYRCQVIEYKLGTKPTSCLRSECVKVADAVALLQRGEEVVVAAFDVTQLRQRLASFAIA